MKRCLVVDDSEVVRKVAHAILAAMGYEIIEAENGQEALELCQVAMPDAILLDWQLPQMGAHEFLAALRKGITGPMPYIVYLATEYNQADITRAFSGGARACLLKPFDRASLEDKFQYTHLAA